MLSCRELNEQVDDLLDGRMPFMRRASLRLHIFMCRHCRLFVKQYRRTLDMIPRVREEASEAEVDAVLCAIDQAVAKPEPPPG